MNRTKFEIRSFILISGCFFLISVACKTDTKKPERKLFEPDNISTKAVDYAITFSPDGSELYFARSKDKWGTRGLKSSIFYSVKENDQWTTPRLASFSGQFDDSGPHLSHDGKTLYFVSNRPSGEAQKSSDDIWRVERLNSGQWSAPVRLGASVNSEQAEYGVRTDTDGNLYFASGRAGGYGQGDLYMAEKIKDSFAIARNLGNTINSAQGEWNLEISKDGNTLIFEASGREQNLSPYGDLYISFKDNGQWSVPQPLSELNTTGSDLYAELIEEDQLLYFASSDSLKSTDVNIYQIEFEDISKHYKQKAVFPKSE